MSIDIDLIEFRKLDIDQQIELINSCINEQKYSINELMSMYENDKIIVNTKYQYQPWCDFKKFNFIEDFILGIIPNFTFVEMNDKLTVVRSIQEFKTLCEFFGIYKNKSMLEINMPPIIGFLTKINGQKFVDLPLSIRLKIQQTICSTRILKLDNLPDLKNHLYKYFLDK